MVHRLLQIQFILKDLHVEELQQMGANINKDNGTATIKPSTLNGAEVYASDLRAGACLIVAGLIAEGVINDIQC